VIPSFANYDGQNIGHHPKLRGNFFILGMILIVLFIRFLMKFPVCFSPNILELARGTANMLARRQHFLMTFNGKKCINVRLETNILGIAQSH
jgi:hypothetical protein